MCINNCWIHGCDLKPEDEVAKKVDFIYTAINLRCSAAVLEILVYFHHIFCTWFILEILVCFLNINLSDNCMQLWFLLTSSLIFR